MDGGVMVRLVYLDEVLARLGVSYGTLRRYVRSGELVPPRHIDRRLAWTPEELEAFVATLPRSWPRGRGRPRKGDTVVDGEGRVMGVGEVR